MDTSIYEDLINYWRNTLEENGSIKLPRMIYGKPSSFLLSLTEDVLNFDAFYLTRNHLDRMSNVEVIEYIESQTHTIH